MAQIITQKMAKVTVPFRGGNYFTFLYCWINITVPKNTFLREPSIPPYMSWTKMSNSPGPSTDPKGTCHWSPLGHWAIDHDSMRVTIQTIPYSPSGPFVMSTCLQFRDTVVVQGRVKCFAQVWVDGISKSPENTNKTEKNGENDACGLCVHECQKKCSLFYFSSLHEILHKILRAYISAATAWRMVPLINTK